MKLKELEELTLEYVKDKNLSLPLDLTNDNIRKNFISYLTKNNVSLKDRISLLMGNFEAFEDEEAKEKKWQNIV
tara:strand:+ start:1236 stop:1457 length:222 start_codon:yes stop_codon:yes gene_type:complete